MDESDDRSVHLKLPLFGMLQYSFIKIGNATKRWIVLYRVVFETNCIKSYSMEKEIQQFCLYCLLKLFII